MRKSWAFTSVFIVLFGFLALSRPQTSSAQVGSEYDFAAFKADLDFVLSKSQAALLFTPFGSNPDPNFKKHRLHDTQALELCGGTQGECGKLGVNFGTKFSTTEAKYEKATSFGMDYTLQIAERTYASSAVSDINNSDSTTIVRIGIVGSGLGFGKWNADPNAIAGDYIQFLKTVAGQTNKDFYAIAGPNEPDLEANWFAPECKNFPNGDETENQEFYDCIGPKLAAYMNAVCVADLPDNIKLLSPAFNLTSPSFDGIFSSMVASGANFSCVDALAGNLYPAGQSMAKYWEDKKLDSKAAALGKKWIITETGPTQSFPVDLSKFYLTPFQGITSTGGVNYASVRRELIDQGYQAYCAIPETNIAATIGPQDMVDRFLQLGNSATFDLTPILTVDLTSANSPLFRDTERKFELKSDFEEYWNYQATGGDRYSQAELESAPIESLLSESQRCTQGAKNLVVQDKLCKNLADPSGCTLYQFAVPNTGDTIETLYKKFESEGGSDTNAGTLCTRLELSEDESEKQLFTDLTQVPLTIERGYRLAFLVLKIEEQKSGTNKLFSFFKHNLAPRDEVIVVAFKIPDVITNKTARPGDSGAGMLTESKSYPYFADGAMLARDSLLTTAQQKKAAEIQDEAKTALHDGVGNVETQNESNLIYCIDGEAGSETCKSSFVKALTDIVNAQATLNSNFNCVDPNEIDDSYTINEPVQIGKQKPPALFSSALGGELLANIFGTITGSAEADKAEQNFTSTIVLNNDTKDGNRQTKVQGFLVYPVGYELNEVQNVLANSFLTTTQIAELEQDENNNERFEMFGGTTQLTENSKSISFFDSIKCAASGEPDCYSSITATLELALEPIQFLGAKLGYYLRAIQRTLAKEASSVQTYLANCKTTEEFLLDQCAGISKEPPEQSLTYCGMKELPITNSSTDLLQMCKATWTWDCELVDQGSDKYFLDSSSKHTLEYSVRILDGATLVTTGSVVTMNPGQGYDEGGSIPRCSGHGHTKGAGPGEVWYLPADTPIEEVEFERTWEERGSKLRLNSEDIDWVNYVVKLQVKPGYYSIPVDNYGCLSGENIWINKEGQQSTEKFKLGGSIVPVGVTAAGRSSYCAKVSLNSNMPGGPSDSDSVLRDKSFSCPVTPSYNITLNNSCGGLGGSGDLQLWRDYFKENPDPAGLDQYEKIFGIKFNLPNDNASCGELFPNTIREVGCDETNNSEIGSIANFGKDIEFEMEYWNGSTVMFRPPSQKIWQSINEAAERHGCDPLLVLAVAHSESSEFRNDTVSYANGKGVWQFPPGPWKTWWTPYAGPEIAPVCANHEPTYFTKEYRENLKLDYSSPTNIPAAADAACRLIMWTGMQKYPEDELAFANVFAIKGENSYGQIWNSGQTHQAKYAWKLWRRLRDEMGEAAVTPPADYPPTNWEACLVENTKQN